MSDEKERKGDAAYFRGRGTVKSPGGRASVHSQQKVAVRYPHPPLAGGAVDPTPQGVDCS